MIEKIVVTALVVLFLHLCTLEGMIFYYITLWFKKVNAPDKLTKPLFSCPICMCPWWGPVVISLGIINNIWQVSGMIEVMIICFAAGGVNAVFNYIIGACRSFVKNIKAADGEKKNKLMSAIASK